MFYNFVNGTEIVTSRRTGRKSGQSPVCCSFAYVNDLQAESRGKVRADIHDVVS